MKLSKREFLQLTGAAGVAAAMPAGSATLAAVTGLENITGGLAVISVDERRARVAKAQRLLAEHGIDALLLEAGSALVYFTGVRWWRSERYTGAIIPRDGEIAFVTPYFEEPSVRESMSFGDDVRTWHEHENPFALVAGILADRGLKSGRIGIEETVRHFIVDGVQQAAPKFGIVSANPVTRGCRMYKSPAEIALMQAANDVTIAAYRHVHSRVEAGMSPAEISAMMDAATAALGGSPGFSMALLNEASAYPHGSDQPQVVQEGGVILMDCGCSVHDYESDISRTWVFGEPTAKQRRVWETVRRGQELALETATVGTPAGQVDDVVRAYYESQGYGPGYRTPGLSHRLGHGIGMDGHEPVNFVHGEATPLAPGMCFSNEPGIYLFGEFGVRLEDCLYMTDGGPKLFTALSPSLDRPFG
ncbi:MAG: Xaa-Pro peptidase family protein [Gammaproteobacteria bacterium]|nr:Xaa-Pro peptidase family protein [Gammaproteobacteria bacterium]MDH4255351.1 Xaa-Pro peptidase family protein [Gammaproteobacteria bacterium]MDH5310909.1 Xaa-Pro peptidase family protein [Gammaproteobacteria bacterium]